MLLMPRLHKFVLGRILLSQKCMLIIPITTTVGMKKQQHQQRIPPWWQWWWTHGCSIQWWKMIMKTAIYTWCASYRWKSKQSNKQNLGNGQLWLTFFNFCVLLYLLQNVTSDGDVGYKVEAWSMCAQRICMVNNQKMHIQTGVDNQHSSRIQWKRQRIFWKIGVCHQGRSIIFLLYVKNFKPVIPTPCQVLGTNPSTPSTIDSTYCP